MVLSWILNNHMTNSLDVLHKIQVVGKHEYFTSKDLAPHSRIIFNTTKSKYYHIPFLLTLLSRFWACSLQAYNSVVSDVVIYLSVKWSSCYRDMILQYNVFIFCWQLHLKVAFIIYHTWSAGTFWYLFTSQ